MPSHVEDQHWQTITAELKSLRHWLLIYVAFTVVAVITIWHAAFVRRTGAQPTIAVYEAGQRVDLYSALASGAIVLTCWGLTFRWLFQALAIGVAFTIVASIGGLVSQSRVAIGLLRALAESADENVGQQLSPARAEAESGK